VQEKQVVGDEVNQELDCFLRRIRDIRRTLYLAYATLQCGEKVIASIEDHGIIEPRIGGGIRIEPIPIRELRQYSATLPTFLLQVFHGKAITLWQDLIQSIFDIYVDWHFQGTRGFPELKIRQTKVDLSSTESIEVQIQRQLKRDFGFQKYKERVKLVNDIRSASTLRSSELLEISKHVAVRNAIQHKDGILDEYALKDHGRVGFEMLDDNGNEIVYSAGDSLLLSLPEFVRLERSLLLVAQAWRSWLSTTWILYRSLQKEPL
jgi:hypothetical protein